MSTTSRTDSPCPHPDKEKKPNQRQAQKSLDRLARNHGPQGSLHAYECVCGYWHLGRANKEKRGTRMTEQVQYDEGGWSREVVPRESAGVFTDEQIDQTNFLRQMVDSYQDEWREWVVGLLADGRSFNEVSKATGLSKDTLQRWKREAGR